MRMAWPAALATAPPAKDLARATSHRFPELALVLLPGRPVDQQTRGLDLGDHLRDHVLVHLELADRLPELVPLVAVLRHLVQARLGEDDRPGRRLQERLD